MLTAASILFLGIGTLAAQPVQPHTEKDLAVLKQAATDMEAIYAECRDVEYKQVEGTPYHYRYVHIQEFSDGGKYAWKPSLTSNVKIEKAWALLGPSTYKLLAYQHDGKNPEAEGWWAPITEPGVIAGVLRQIQTRLRRGAEGCYLEPLDHINDLPYLR